jgi:hypothetical protein
VVSLENTDWRFSVNLSRTLDRLISAWSAGIQADMDVPDASCEPGCRQSMPAWRRYAFSCSVGGRKLMKHFVVRMSLSSVASVMGNGQKSCVSRFSPLPPCPGGELFKFRFHHRDAEGSRLRNQNLLHSRNKSWLDFEQSLNNSFGLFSGNVLDIQARFFRFGQKVRIFEGIGEGFA